MIPDLRKDTFTPQYLKELRWQHRNTLDMELVEWAKQEILKANLSGKEWVELAVRVDSSWEKLIKHFEDLGFHVGSSGYTKKQYDDEANEVYCFNFGWHVKEGDEE